MRRLGIAFSPSSQPSQPRRARIWSAIFAAGYRHFPSLGRHLPLPYSRRQNFRIPCPRIDTASNRITEYQLPHATNIRRVVIDNSTVR